MVLISSCWSGVDSSDSHSRHRGGWIGIHWTSLHFTRGEDLGDLGGRGQMNQNTPQFKIHVVRKRKRRVKSIQVERRMKKDEGRQEEEQKKETISDRRKKREKGEKRNQVEGNTKGAQQAPGGHCGTESSVITQEPFCAMLNHQRVHRRTVVYFI